jgi:hypothetical protein
MSRALTLEFSSSFAAFRVVLMAVAALLLLPPAAQAQNPDYTPGDLVLFFQNPGGLTGSEEQVFASLGNTATVFRDAAAGSTSNIININFELTSAFGANWASETTLYGGLGGVWGTSTLGSQLQNGDPQRTIYTSQQRSSIGTVGAPNSAGYSVSADGTMTSIANSITGQNQILEVKGTGATAVVPFDPSSLATSIANQNPANGNGWNNNIPAPGVQQQGQAGDFGTFGTISNVQFMWDVYRIQPRNNISGQYGQGEPIRQSEYLGTIVLNNVGDVYFVAARGASPTPTISLSGSLTPFNTTTGTASASQSFTVSGSDLTGNVTLTAPTGFELSTNNSSFSSTVVVPATGNLSATTIYVRVSSSAAVGSLSGNITATSSGANNQSLPVSANVSAASAYDSWAADTYGLDPSATTGPTAGAPTADPDNDGFANSQEFAFGTSPVVGNAALLSASLVGGNLVITALQRTPGDGVASYVLQTRSDLSAGGWSPSGVTPVSGSASGDYTQVTYTITGVSGRGFYRLLASQ